jgi:hypothetical protein
LSCIQGVANFYAKAPILVAYNLFEPQWVVGAKMNWYLRAMENHLSMGILPDLELLKCLHKQNKGITKRSFINKRVQILKAALDRQREKKVATTITENLSEKKLH